MGKKAIYVFVGWNKARERVEVHPSTIELTDAVDQVTWASYGPELRVLFEDSEDGPFFDLSASLALGVVRGYGNVGPRPPAGPDQYPYKVELQLPDGLKTGAGRVINRATKPKKRKPPTNPLPPSGPPDITLKSTGTTATLSPKTFKMPAGKSFVVWEFEGVKPTAIRFPAAAGAPFEWVEMLPSNCLGVVGSRKLKPGSSFAYEVEVEGLAKPVKGVIRRG